MSKNRNYLLLFSVLFVSLILTACGIGEPKTPTPDPNMIITQVAQTIEANITLTAAAMPTETLTPEPTQTPAMTSTPAITSTPAGTLALPTLGLPTTGGSGVTADAMVFSADVTIPDNTQLSPSSEFTKTWRVKNTGITTWNSGYQLVYWDGVPGNEVDKVLPVKQVKLSGEVKPGAEGDVSVKMVAPSKNGTYKIWWRMLNPQGNPFGDSLYALIIVNNGSLTLVPSVTPTVTPTK